MRHLAHPWQGQDGNRFGPAVFGPAIPIIAVAATALSAGVGAYSAISSANAQSAAANYQAQVAKNNAEIAAGNANYAQQVGYTQEQQQAMKTRAAVGSVITQQAANGLDVNSGSALTVRQSTATEGALSAMNIRNNAAREAYGYRVQGLGYQSQSELDTATAKNAQTAGVLGATGDILGGAASTTTLYQHLASTGAFNPNPPNIVH